MGRRIYEGVRASCVAAYKEATLFLGSDLAEIQSKHPHLPWEQRNAALARLSIRGIEMVRRMINAANEAIGKHKTLGINSESWPSFLSGEAHRGIAEMEQLLLGRFDPNGPLSRHCPHDQMLRYQHEVNSFNGEFRKIQDDISTMAQKAMEGPSAEAKNRTLEETSVTADKTHFHPEPGRTYTFAIMSVDYVGSTALKNRLGEEAAKPLLCDWQDHMFAIIRLYNAVRINWGGDGGLLVFEGQQRAESALIASLHALFYPVARLVRPIIEGESTHIRVVLHHAAFQWEADPGRLNSKDIDLVSKLDKEAGRPNEIVATDAYYRECPERLRQVFTSIGEVREIKVYHASLSRFSHASCALTSTPAQLESIEQTPGKPRSPFANPFVLVREASIFDSGTINDYVALSKLTLENTSDKDVWWIRLRADYFNHEGEVGTKFFSLGNASTPTAILPKGASRTWSYGRKAIKRYGSNEVLWMSNKLTEISGKATGVKVTVVDVKTMR